ncbi:MAG TPA: alkane 1-monooxygenase [Sphingomicrobium sp.]|nr:alkane 1-monooxygenase [Sphingomicrobium sp.]
MPLRFLIPFPFLALVPLGALLGGPFTLLAAAAAPVCLAGMDAVLGEDEAAAGRPDATIPRWLPRIYIVVQLAVTGWAAAWIARRSTTFLEAAGIAVSVGFITGVFGFVAAHEMVHSREKKERALGLIQLASVFYMHFRIAHVYGHHRRAATSEDAATAKLGEGLYVFFVRTVRGQFREAWMFEAERLRRKRKPLLSPGNRMLHYLAIEGALFLFVGLLSWRALAFLVAVAGISVALLEGFNYVAHYGLIRRTEEDGSIEPLAPIHSWNSSRRMNNAALFNMGRHADHHRHMARSYEQLDVMENGAQLPSGYAAALLTALVPPLWRKTMDPRVASYRSC